MNFLLNLKVLDSMFTTYYFDFPMHFFFSFRYQQWMTLWNILLFQIIKGFIKLVSKGIEQIPHDKILYVTHF